VRPDNAAVTLQTHDRFSPKIVDNVTEEFTGCVPRVKTPSDETIQFSKRPSDNKDFVVAFPDYPRISLRAQAVTDSTPTRRLDTR